MVFAWLAILWNQLGRTGFRARHSIVEQFSGVALWDRGRPARTKREARKKGWTICQTPPRLRARWARRPRSEKRLLLMAEPVDEQPQAVFDLGLRVIAQ